MATTTPDELWSPDGTDTRDLTIILQAMQQSVQNAISSLMPTGAVIPFGGETAPSGWLLCRGQSVSRENYAALFDVIGESYGEGDGISTFGVPKMQGRVPVGLDLEATESPNFSFLGQGVGSARVALTVDQMPAHTHRIEGGTAGATTRLRSASARLTEGSSYNAAAWFGTGYSGIDNVRTTEVGAGQSHSNVQPSRVFNYIIKT